LAEESVMREHDYPGYTRHKIRNDQFIERLKSQQESFANHSRQVSFELLTFLNTWLLSHILDADANIGRFLVMAGRLAA
jgi:hemerythrin